jgi:hypothetical protein
MVHCGSFLSEQLFFYDKRFLFSKILIELIVKTTNHVMQPVVDAFDPRLLVSPPIFHTLDFTRMKVTFCSNYELL